MKKKRKFVAGDVFAIPLASDKYAFGVCCGNDFAFFNFRADVPVMPENLLDLPLAFRVPVAKDATASGGWGYVGNVELKGEYSKPAKYLHKAVGSDQCFIYSAGEEVAASREECQGLEVLSTWFSFHIQERLEDFFAGRENIYVTAIKKQMGI